jgi:hypothetical protein
LSKRFGGCFGLDRKEYPFGTAVTLYDLLVLVGLGVGAASGAKIGSTFGTVAAVLGGTLGGILGIVVGRIPFFRYSNRAN